MKFSKYEMENRYHSYALFRRFVMSYIDSKCFVVGAFLVHGQVTIIFVVSVCLFVQSFPQPSLIRFRSN